MRRAILFFFLFQVLFAVHAYAESKEYLGDVIDSSSQHNFLEATKKPAAIIDKNRQNATATSLKTGDDQRAIDDYSSTNVQADHDNAVSNQLPFNFANGVYMSRCIESVRRNDFNSTIEACSKAIELDPGNWYAYRLRSLAYAKLGNPRQAIQDCEAAAKLGDKECQDWLKQAVQREKQLENTLRLLCRLFFRYDPPLDLSITVDLASGTVNGHQAKITDDAIYWTDTGTWFQINRYTGAFICGETGVNAVTGRCVKAEEKQF